MNTESPDSRAQRYEWWSTLPLEKFKERILAMADDELNMLAAELRGGVAVVSSQVQTRDGTRDADWFRKARRALGHLTAKRQVLRVELHRRNITNRDAKEERKAEIIADARAALAAGGMGDALRLVLDVLEGKHHVSYHG